METAIAPARGGDLSRAALRWSGRLLAAVCWISAGIFGVYILAAYGGALASGDLERWNEALPRLYESDTPTANSGIGLHFAAGGLILILGPIQLVGAVRRNWPAVHRWIGRFYGLACFLAGVGGLTFIALKGTVGGWPMTIGFSIYGILMVLASVQTVRHAIARRLDEHRAWAIRLFALAIGSWLYRIEYGFWHLMFGDFGTGPSFSGWFDWIMDFFFYIPNLVIAEMFIRARRSEGSVLVRWGASAGLAASAVLVGLATFFFTAFIWGPGILNLPRHG
jgi:hypothetical protein